MIYAVSDLHIGSGHEDSDALAQFIDIMPEGSICWRVGDTHELLLATKHQVITSPAYRLCRKAKRQKNITWLDVEGNHNLGDGVAIGGDSQTPDIIMLHGHQFDFIWDERHEQWLWWKLKRLLKIASETPWAEKMANKDDRYVDHVGRIHARAIRWLQRSPYKQLLIGHTHCPITHRLPDGRKVIDLGDLTLGSRTYAELVDGKFVLKQL